MQLVAAEGTLVWEEHEVTVKVWPFLNAFKFSAIYRNDVKRSLRARCSSGRGSMDQHAANILCLQWWRRSHAAALSGARRWLPLSNIFAILFPQGSLVGVHVITPSTHLTTSSFFLRETIFPLLRFLQSIPCINYYCRSYYYKDLIHYLLWWE